MIDDKINLFLDITAIPAVHHNSHIYAVTPADQIIVDDVFRDMAGIVLPVIEPGIPQTNIRVVVYIGIIEIGLALDIIPLTPADQECIDSMRNIGGN